MKQSLMLGLGLALMASVATQVMAQDDLMSDDSAASRPLDTTASEAILRNSTTSSDGTTKVVNSVEAVSSTTQLPNGNTVQQTTTTVKQVIVPGDAAAQPETVAQTTGAEPFNVIMPDGTKLQITEQEWWKDARLNGYTRFWFDTVANAYRPVVEKDNTTYQKRENTWCTPEQSSAGKC